MRALFSRWSLLGLGITCVGFPLVWVALANRHTAVALATTDSGVTSESQGDSEPQVSSVRVETVKPQKGGIDRTTTQPGTVIAFESAQLFAKVSGYLKSQAVDIGDRVHQGQVLAEIDAPELQREADEAKAAWHQAQAQAVQATARIHTAEADQEAAVAAIKQAEAEIGRATAAFSFREKQYQRIKNLFELKSIDERLVDEKLSEMDAARAAEHAAIAGVANAKALANAASARVEQAKADAVAAVANVEVAEASLAKKEVFVQYLKIVSPYDGVVTKRNFFRGDFIRSADQESRVPLLVVDRTDLMRVVVQIPDRDVPFTNPGAAAVAEIDALPGMRFTGKVARVAEAEDTESRTMRTEIDLANPDKTLRQGMYGRLTIRLPSTLGAVRVPATALVGAVNEGKGAIYVNRNGTARLVPITVGTDDGVQVEILTGVSPQDDVIFRYNGALSDGTRVSVVRPGENPGTAPNNVQHK